jgi:hypothetical protein
MNLGNNIVLTSISKPADGAVVINCCYTCAKVTIQHSMYAPPPNDGGQAWFLNLQCAECLMMSVTSGAGLMGLMLRGRA